MFERHATVVTVRELPFSKDAVLSIVHNPDRLIRLNPLVIKCHVLPSLSQNPSGNSESSTSPKPAGKSTLANAENEAEETWEIDDRMLLCGFFPMTWTYTAAFTRTPDGIVAYPKAGMGVRLKNVWNIEPIEAGDAGGAKGAERTRVTETAEIWAPFWAVGFVKETLSKAHEDLMEALERRLEEERDQGGRRDA